MLATGWTHENSAPQNSRRVPSIHVATLALGVALSCIGLGCLASVAVADELNGKAAADEVMPAIGLSQAIPVINQPVTVTAGRRALALAEKVLITPPIGDPIRLSLDEKGTTTWVPTRYGKHNLSIGDARLETWVTSRPLTFHWWDVTSRPRFVTVAMVEEPEREAAYWRARGVFPVVWAAGECKARACDCSRSPEAERPVPWSEPEDWYKGWYGNNALNRQYAGGIAIDEACLTMETQPLTTKGIAKAMIMTRAAAGPSFHIGLYVTNIADPIAAWYFRESGATALIEHYYGDLQEAAARWQEIASRWRLNERSLLAVAPGFTLELEDEDRIIFGPQTESQVRQFIADARRAAPEMAGLALFNDSALGLDALVDQAIEDYFLKPVIFLHPDHGKLAARNIGNEDAHGVSVVFLGSDDKALERMALPRLKPDEDCKLTPPAAATALRLELPEGMANLYPDSLFFFGQGSCNRPSGDFPATLDPLQVVESSIENGAVVQPPEGPLLIRVRLSKQIQGTELAPARAMLTGFRSGQHESRPRVLADGRTIEIAFDDPPEDCYMFCLRGHPDTAIRWDDPLVDSEGFGLDGDQDGVLEPDDWFTLFFTLDRAACPK